MHSLPLPAMKNQLRLLLACVLPMAGCTSVDIEPHHVREVQSLPVMRSQQEPVKMPERKEHLPQFESERLHEPPPTTVPRAVVPPSVAPPASGPAPLSGCDPGGCWSAGERYNGGTGDTFLNRQGRLCQRNGAWMQCF